MSATTRRTLTDLGYDVLLNVCAEIFEDPRERITLSWCGEIRMENEPPRILPGPPAQILLDLAPMHSQLAAATRPYIWNEVLLAFNSDDPTEAGLGRFERAQQPHIASYVRALFLSCHFPCGNDADSIPRIASIISQFTGLRAVCFGTFQSYSQPRMYAPLAAALRVHPCIDTLVVWHMARCNDLIEQGSTRAYHIHLEYCHDGFAALLARPKKIAALSLQNTNHQDLATHMPARIWDSLEYLAPGYPDMTMVDRPQMQPSLKAYLTSGRTSALRALDLSHISHYFPGWKDWIKLGRKLPLLDSFTYAPRSMASMDEAKDMLKAFRHVRRLHFVDPSQGGFDEEEDLEEIEFSSEFVTLLSKFLSLERLVLNVWVPNYLLNDDEHDPEGIGWAAVEELVETCEELESVQLRYFWEGIGCEDEPVIVEYAVKTTGEGFTLEVTEPKILEGTILDFLDWR